jgi:hypothetical protein
MVGLLGLTALMAPAVGVGLDLGTEGLSRARGCGRIAWQSGGSTRHTPRVLRPCFVAWPFTNGRVAWPGTPATRRAYGTRHT